MQTLKVSWLFLHEAQEHKNPKGVVALLTKCNNIQTLKLSRLFLHEVQQHINPKGVVALLTLSATTYNPETCRGPCYIKCSNI